MADKELITRQTGQADAAVRAMRAWSARVAGHTWQEAAELSGFTDGSNACRAVSRYFGTLPEVSREDARALWRQRHEALWRVALQDAEANRPGALRAGVAVARSAAQLDGLDEPTRVQVSPGAIEFEQLVAALVAARGGPTGGGEADIFAIDSVEDHEAPRVAPEP